jgi:hypothetical protein
MVTCTFLSLDLDADLGPKRFLRCRVQSDLPPGTLLMVMVYREYLAKDGEAQCWIGSESLECMLSEQSSGRAGALLELPIDDFDRSALKSFRKMEGSGRWLQRGVSDEVLVEVFLGLKNGLPKIFGRNNRELQGEIVLEEGGMRTVRVEKTITIPLAADVREAVGPVVRPPRKKKESSRQSAGVGLEREDELFRKAVLLLDKGQAERAEELLRSAIDLAEEHENTVTEIQARSCYGEWLLHTGRSEEARSEFLAILDLRGKGPMDDLDEFEWAEQRLRGTEP